MGLFPQCVITKFLDASSENEMNEEAFQLLSAFFESTTAQEVECSGDRCSTIEAARRLSGQIAPNPSSDPILELMKQLVENHDRGFFQKGIGGTFSVCHGKDSKSRWRFLLNRKQIPFFYLYTNHGEGFHTQKQWAEVFFGRGVSHVVWLDGVFGIGKPKCYGSNANQYLFWKCQSLLSKVPLIPIPDHETARLLSHEFRRTCQNVYERGKMNLEDTAILSAWSWKTIRSIKAFDNALIDEAGLEKLTTTLNAMGITVDEWFEH
jgi:hypothetical protein